MVKFKPDHFLFYFTVGNYNKYYNNWVLNNYGANRGSNFSNSKILILKK